jgi:hypothetical protein
VLGHGKPIFRDAGATPSMFSMLPHKQNIVSPHRILVLAVYGVCIDGILLTGNLRAWKQGPPCQQGLGVQLAKLPTTKRINHFPRLHPLISGFNQVAFGFCSRATLKCPNAKTFRTQIIDLGDIEIILTINKQRAFLESSKSRKSRNYGLLFSPHLCMLHAF